MDNIKKKFDDSEIELILSAQKYPETFKLEDRYFGRIRTRLEMVSKLSEKMLGVDGHVINNLLKDIVENSSTLNELAASMFIFGRMVGKSDAMADILSSPEELAKITALIEGNAELAGQMPDGLRRRIQQAISKMHGANVTMEKLALTRENKNFDKVQELMEQIKVLVEEGNAPAQEQVKHG